MKIDDPELQKKIKEAVERKKKIDELRLAVLEGHLLMEEALDEFVEASMFHPEHLNHVNPNFHTKGHLALALSLQQDKDPFWTVFWAINQLRNKIAHKLDSTDIQEKMKYLRQCYLSVLSPEQKAYAEQQLDKYIVEVSCQVCTGFLATLTEDAKARRKIIDQRWTPRA